MFIDSLLINGSFIAARTIFSAGKCLLDRCLATNYSIFQVSCHSIIPQVPSDVCFKSLQSSQQFLSSSMPLQLQNECALFFGFQVLGSVQTEGGAINLYIERTRIAVGNFYYRCQLQVVKMLTKAKEILYSALNMILTVMHP